MDAASVVLLIVAILTAVILGTLVAVTFSLMLTLKRINERMDDLDENLVELVSVMTNLSESSQTELSQLHETLAEQQRVHQSIRATSRLVDIVFRKPVVNTAAASRAVGTQRSKRKRRKAQKVDAK